MTVQHSISFFKRYLDFQFGVQCVKAWTSSLLFLGKENINKLKIDDFFKEHQRTEVVGPLFSITKTYLPEPYPTWKKDISLTIAPSRLHLI